MRLCSKKCSGPARRRGDSGISRATARDFVRCLADKLGGSIRGIVPCDGAHPVTRHLYETAQTGRGMQELQESVLRSYEAACRSFGKFAVTRRDYLRATVAAAAGGLLPFTSSCALGGGYHDLSDFTGPGPGDTAAVGLARAGSIEESVRVAIELAGGLSSIGPGESVVIKPNCVWFSGKQGVETAEPDAPTTTNPEVVRAVIRAVKERNGDAGKIFIADHSARITSTPFIMMLLGYYALAMEEGARVMPWDATRHLSYYSDKFNYLKQRVAISSTVLKFDHFINVPVLKNHNIPQALAGDQAQYTCCLKAFVGVIRQSSRSFGADSFHASNLPEHAAELNLCRPYVMPGGRPGITMNVVDATRIIVDGGPHNSIFGEVMKVAEPGMIIASSDRVACDSVALSVLKRYGALRGVSKDYMDTPVWQQRQLRHAALLNLGIADTSRIEIQASGIESAEMAEIEGYWKES